LYVPEKVEMRRNVAEMIDRYVLEHLSNKPKNKDQKNPERHLQWCKQQIGNTKLPRLTPDLITHTRNKLVGGKTRTGEKLAITAEAG
jgi:hypothetical protein